MAIDPILNPNNKSKTSTLNDKTVDFSTGNDFGNPTFVNSVEETEAKPTRQKKSSNSNKRYSTQRLMEETAIKCRTLQPFMEELDRTDKASINDVIEVLAQFYIDNGLSDRQKDVYQGMYEMNINRTKN